MIRQTTEHFVDARGLRTQNFARRKTLSLCGRCQAYATRANYLGCISMANIFRLQIGSAHLVAGKVHLKIAIINWQLVQIPNGARSCVRIIVRAKTEALRLFILTIHEFHVAIRSNCAQSAIQSLLTCLVQVIGDVAKEHT